MLVRVTNAVVVSAANEYGEWSIDDGSGPCTIDDGSFTSPMYDGDWFSPNVGDTLQSIVGVVTYSYNRFRLLPRNENDFNGDIDGSSLALYPIRLTKIKIDIKIYYAIIKICL